MYITADDFELRAGSQETIELTNLDNPAATSINQSRLAIAIADASGEINGYLASRYDTPLSQVPSFIKLYCFDIARYRLSENNSPETYKEKYDAAIARLQEIEKGKMLLVDDDGNAIPKRDDQNQLIDERGNLLDDYTLVYTPSPPGFVDLGLF